MSHPDEEIPDLIFAPNQNSTQQQQLDQNQVDPADDDDMPPDLVPISTSTTNQSTTIPTSTTSPSSLSNEPEPTQSTLQLPSTHPNKPVPLTILTGWLGSGKTTLLHNIVQHISKRNETVAILQNETSSFMGVEKSLKLTDDEQQVFGEMLEIANGCVCCSVRSDFLLAIDTLLSKRQFDYVVLECSGIADVGNLITSLWADKALGCTALLDAVLCLVDSQQLLLQLQETIPNSTITTNNTTPPQLLDFKTKSSLNTALNILKNQIVYADVVLINKLDKCIFESVATYLPQSKSKYDTIQLFSPRLLEKSVPEVTSNSPSRTTSQSRHTSTHSNQSELVQMIDYLNYNANQNYTVDLDSMPSSRDTNTISTSNEKILNLTNSVSNQLHSVLSFIYKINPTLQTLFSYQSNINIDSILNLNQYSLNSKTTFMDNLRLETLSPTTTSSSTSSSTTTPSTLYQSSNSHSNHVTNDKPKTSYNIRGVTVWTENKALIPTKYIPTPITNPNDDTCCSSTTPHCHKDCHIQHQHHYHHHNPKSNEQIDTEQFQFDLHGISTVVITMKQPGTKQIKPSKTPWDKDTPCKAWGFDVGQLTANLDNYLFSGLQTELEEELTMERYNFRQRFHGSQENPNEIVDDLLNIQKEKKLLERKQHVEKILNNTTNNVQDKNDVNLSNNNTTPSDFTPTSLPNQSTTTTSPTIEDESILTVPQMDAIEKEVIYRMKGVFSIHNRIPKWYLQSVFSTFDLLPTEQLQTDEHSSQHDEIYSDPQIYHQYYKSNDIWHENDERYCSMIVIGVNINIERLVDVFLNSLPNNKD